MAFDGDDYREMRDRNRKHRHNTYDINVRHAKNLNVEIIEKSWTWFFSLPNGKKVHFYPTKNTWRIIPSAKNRTFKGGFKKFHAWLNNQQNYLTRP